MAPYDQTKKKKTHSYLDIVSGLFAPIKLQCDVITNEYKRCPVSKFSGLSHAVHCPVKGFTCTFSFHKMLIEFFHKLKSGLVVNRPQ